MTNSTTFGRPNTGKQFRLPLPKSMRTVKYNQVEVVFVDSDTTVPNRSRICTYVDDDLNDFINELRLVYKDITLLKKKNGIEQVQVKLEPGTSVQESFEKFRAPKK